MDFNTFLNKAWDDHAKDSKGVAMSMNQGLSLAQNGDQLGQLARLAAHVFGEHLGQWDDGISFLNQIKKHSQMNEASSNLIKIYEASLNFSGNTLNDLSQFSKSEQVRILSISASAVYEQGQPEKAKDYFCNAVDLASSGITKEDSANRALAVAGNNLACSLEEKPSRTPQEVDLMILSAQIARKFWEIAGGWMETERAEYRLSQSYLKANKIEESFVHAQKCIEICETNSAPALEYFFGFECLALVEKVKGNEIGYKTAVQNMKKYFDQLSEDDKSWCQSTLKKFS